MEEFQTFWRRWVLGPLFGLIALSAAIALTFAYRDMPAQATSFGWIGLYTLGLTVLSLIVLWLVRTRKERHPSARQF